jgi:hypothetical protein
VPRCVFRHLPVSFERFHRGARTESGLAAATRDDCVHGKQALISPTDMRVHCEEPKIYVGIIC